MREELGRESRIFFLPDTFGYSCQLPQILRNFKMPYFVSQKLSWNLLNKFEHNSFYWEVQKLVSLFMSLSPQL